MVENCCWRCWLDAWDTVGGGTVLGDTVELMQCSLQCSRMFSRSAPHLSAVSPRLTPPSCTLYRPAGAARCRGAGGGPVQESAAGAVASKYPPGRATRGQLSSLCSARALGCVILQHNTTPLLGRCPTLYQVQVSCLLSTIFAFPYQVMDTQMA